jgi:hypothetical protein
MFGLLYETVFNAAIDITLIPIAQRAGRNPSRGRTWGVQVFGHFGRFADHVQISSSFHLQAQ